MSDQKDNVENPVDNSELDNTEQSVEAPEQVEETAPAAVETVENDSTANTEDVSSQPVEIITEGGESVHAELKPETEVVEAEEQPDAEVMEAEDGARDVTPADSEVEGAEGGAEVTEESPETPEESKIEDAVGAAPVDTEMTETSTISVEVPRGKFMNPKRLKLSLQILGILLAVAGISALIYGIMLGVGARDEPTKQNTRAQNEQVAEQLQEIVQSGDLDKCEDLTDSVEGEPAGKWCQVGEFRAFIPN